MERITRGRAVALIALFLVLLCVYSGRMYALQMLDAGPDAIPYMVLLYMIPLCYGVSKKWLTRNLFSRKGAEI